jgi:hypothetical protein
VARGRAVPADRVGYVPPESLLRERLEAGEDAERLLLDQMEGRVQGEWWEHEVVHHEGPPGTAGFDVHERRRLVYALDDGDPSTPVEYRTWEGPREQYRPLVRADGIEEEPATGRSAEGEGG